VDQAREGDHICYISDLRKMKRHYPNWSVTRSLDDIFDEVVHGWMCRLEQAQNGERLTVQSGTGGKAFGLHAAGFPGNER
jgi:hypothetical protein